MKFGPVAVTDAEGAVLAHTVSAGPIRFRKARRLSAADVQALIAVGVTTVVAAVLAPDDLEENEAAAQLAAVLGGTGTQTRAATTGRVNVHAATAGVFMVEPSIVHAINAIDPAVTVATLPPFASVQADQMIATVKIIPFAVSAGVAESVLARASARTALDVVPFRPARVALIQTEHARQKSSVLDKTASVTADRLTRSTSRIVTEVRIPHNAGALARTLRAVLPDCDLIVVFGATAVSDPHDVIPAAIRTARGVVKRVGIPVDPGNLLVLGEIEGTPVIGAPGCARSPKENGFDWVLDRVLAGIDLSDTDFGAMGVGGLLPDILTRPAPRDRPDISAEEERHGARTNIDAIILAAGRSSRMNGQNKLFARFDGISLIRRVAMRVLKSGVRSTTVVVGHQAPLIREELAGLDLRIVDNPAFADGLSTSLQVGIGSLPSATMGAMIMLGDMPAVDVADLSRIVDAYNEHGGTAIVRATDAGRRGNPVILPLASFAEIRTLRGDVGARGIVESGTYDVIDVEIGMAASQDVDTPDVLRAAGGTFET